MPRLSGRPAATCDHRYAGWRCSADRSLAWMRSAKHDMLPRITHVGRPEGGRRQQTVGLRVVMRNDSRRKQI